MPGKALGEEEVGQLDRALADAERAVELAPGLAEAYMNRGVAFRQHGNVSGADGYAEIPDAEAQFVAAAARRKVEVKILRPGQSVKWRP